MKRAETYFIHVELPRGRDHRRDGDHVASHEFAHFTAALCKELSGDLPVGRRIAAEDPGSAGDHAEETWAAALRRWLPAQYPIVTKGRILNELGFTSPQVDILVLDPSYPMALRSKKLYFSAGVRAVFECKLRVRRRDILAFFQTTKKIRALYEEHTGSPYHELIRGPYIGLLGHSHAWKLNRVNAESRIEAAIDHAADAARGPVELPDGLCVGDTASFLCTRDVVISNETKGDLACRFSQPFPHCFSKAFPTRCSRVTVDHRGYATSV